MGSVISKESAERMQGQEERSRCTQCQNKYVEETVRPAYAFVCLVQ